MENPKFQLFQSDANGEFYFRLRAGNGEPVLASEGYTTKENCMNGISSVKINSQRAEAYTDKIAKDDQYYFAIKAVNSQIIGVSEMYSTEAARDNGKKVVHEIAASAPTEDLTLKEN